MSLHRSLISHSGLKRPRNVLNRYERLLILEKKGDWKEGDSIFGLRKVRGERKIKKIKTVKAEKAADATAAPAPAAAATTGAKKK